MIRILIADDQNLVRQALKYTLGKEANLEVVAVAQDGSEALLKAEQFKPDIILMDINMPKMNGLEATKAIARHYPEIKVISLSGDEKDHLLALNYGAKSYLSKSTTALELAERIRQVYYQPKKNSSLVEYQLNRQLQSVPRQTEPLDEISLSTFDSNKYSEIINAEFQMINEDTVVTPHIDSSEVEPSQETHKPRSKGTRSDEETSFIPPTEGKAGSASHNGSSTNKHECNDRSKIEEAVTLWENYINEFKAKHIALIDKYDEIAHNVQSMEKKQENLFHQIDLTLQQYKRHNSHYSIRLEERLVRFDSILTPVREQIRLIANLCKIAIFLITIFSLIALTTFAILWS